MRTAQTLLQEKIDISQWLDDIEFGLRSIKACNGALYCTNIHAAQLYRAASAAGVVLDRTAETIVASDGLIEYEEGGRTRRGFNVEGRLKQARAIFRECLAETKAELKAIGGVRQLRLALESGGHDYALAA